MGMLLRGCQGKHPWPEHHRGRHDDVAASFRDGLCGCPVVVVVVAVVNFLADSGGSAQRVVGSLSGGGGFQFRCSRSKGGTVLRGGLVDSGWGGRRWWRGERGSEKL